MKENKEKFSKKVDSAHKDIEETTEEIVEESEEESDKRVQKKSDEKNENSILKYIKTHNKVVVPAGVVLLAALTVLISLNLSKEKEKRMEDFEPEVTQTVESSEVVESQPDYASIALVENKDPKIESLIMKFYNSQVTGDVEAIASCYDSIPEEEVIAYQEMAPYLAEYSNLKIYTQDGYKEGDTVVYVSFELVFKGKETEVLPGIQTYYVSTGENGNLFIKNNNYLTDEENDYAYTLIDQPDVVNLFNSVKVAYKEAEETKPELIYYISEVKKEVSKKVGVILAQKIAEENAPEVPEDNNGEVNGETTTSEPTEPVTIYAKASTTVNVRSSDSEKADKLGKAKSGLKMEVLEQRENGWSKVIYEGKEGFIKSEFLTIVESTDNVEVIGKIKAKTNINIREKAGTDSESLGILTGGDAADLVAVEGEWCKIKYNGKIGYVKSEFVEK